MSVDPKSHWYPSMSPYNFTANNPVMLVDPNGQWVEGGGFWNNLFCSDNKVVEKMAQKHADEIGGEVMTIDGGYRVSKIGGGNYDNNEVGEVYMKDFDINKLSRNSSRERGLLNDSWSVEANGVLTAATAGFNFQIGGGKDTHGNWYWYIQRGYSVGLDASIGLSYTTYNAYDGGGVSYDMLNGEGQSYAFGFLYIDGESGGDSRASYPWQMGAEYRNPQVNKYYSETLGFSIGMPVGFSHNWTTTKAKKF